MYYQSTNRQCPTSSYLLANQFTKNRLVFLEYLTTILLPRNIKLISQIIYSLNNLNQSSILLFQLLVFNDQNIISLIESNINLVTSFKVERIVILIIGILYYYLYKINSILYIRSYLRKVLQQSILYREAKIQSKAKIYFIQSKTSKSL